MLVEDLSIEMHANVRLHVLWAVIEDLVGVEALGHGPCAHHVVHHPLAERLRYLVEFHEFAHVVKHVVILGSGRRHLLDYRRYVSENRGVQQGFFFF